MVACYIEQSFPAFLGLTHKYSANFETAVCASANAGGENVARGALLGAVLGAAQGLDAFPAWSLEGLVCREQALAEIDDLLAAWPGAADTPAPASAAPAATTTAAP